MAEQQAKKKTVAIVGAGISGLAVLKECLAEGLDAVAFDTADHIGGAWAYSADLERSAMYAGVVMNTCRDTSAYTDFPMDPARYPDYFSHTLVLRYLNEYADHFALRPHIRLRTRVLGCVPNTSKDGGPSWTVRTQAEGTDEAEEHVFDAVVAATGHLSTPIMPDFEGKAGFKGLLIHSNQYKTPGPFEGKKVAVIGMGSSAIDIACEVAPQAKELHLITRRGGWVLPRYVLGKPSEAFDNRASQLWLPHSFSQWLQTKLLNLLEGAPPPSLVPEHGMMEANVSIRGDFLEKVRTGLITVQRAGVDRFTEAGVALSTGVTLEDVDVVISCTGYKQLDLPYLPADTLRNEDTPPLAADLYRFTASPRYPSLFTAGLAETIGPLPPLADAQGRFIAATVSGRISLPSQEEMRREVAAYHAFQAKRFVRSERHALTAYIATTVDSILEPLGAAPTFPRLLSRVFTSGRPWTALRALNAAWFGIPAGAMWRLVGHGNKEELAQETLLRIADGKGELSKRECELLGREKIHKE